MIPTLSFLLCFAALAGDEASASRLQHECYSGYFVSNRFEPKTKESSVIINDQKHFDEVFGVAFVMNDKSHRLPTDAFKSNLVLAVIKRGNTLWEYKVEKISVEQGVVQFRYTATSEATPDTTFACPLIVSVPKGDYKAVTFIENGKVIKDSRP